MAYSATIEFKPDQRIRIEQKVVTRGTNGEEVTTWALFAVLWAEVWMLRGREFFAAAQLQASYDAKVRIHFRRDITRAMRIVWNGQPLDIAAPPIEVGRHELLELMCIAGVRNG